MWDRPPGSYLPCFLPFANFLFSSFFFFSPLATFLPARPFLFFLFFYFFRVSAASPATPPLPARQSTTMAGTRGQEVAAAAAAAAAAATAANPPSNPPTGTASPLLPYPLADKDELNNPNSNRIRYPPCCRYAKSQAGLKLVYSRLKSPPVRCVETTSTFSFPFSPLQCPP